MLTKFNYAEFTEATRRGIRDGLREQFERDRLRGDWVSAWLARMEARRTLALDRWADDGGK